MSDIKSEMMNEMLNAFEAMLFIVGDAYDIKNDNKRRQILAQANNIRDRLTDLKDYIQINEFDD